MPIASSSKGSPTPAPTSKNRGTMKNSTPVNWCLRKTSMNCSSRVGPKAMITRVAPVELHSSGRRSGVCEGGSQSRLMTGSRPSSRRATRFASSCSLTGPLPITTQRLRNLPASRRRRSVANDRNRAMARAIGMATTKRSTHRSTSWNAASMATRRSGNAARESSTGSSLKALSEIRGRRWVDRRNSTSTIEASSNHIVGLTTANRTEATARARRSKPMSRVASTRADDHPPVTGRRFGGNAISGLGSRVLRVKMGAVQGSIDT